MPVTFVFWISISTKVAIATRKNMSFSLHFRGVYHLHDYPGRERGGYLENSVRMFH